MLRRISDKDEKLVPNIYAIDRVASRANASQNGRGSGVCDENGGVFSGIKALNEPFAKGVTATAALYGVRLSRRFQPARRADAGHTWRLWRTTARL